MKTLQLLLLLILISFIPASAQNKKVSREQKRYLSAYDFKKLTPENSPVLLPYNRYITPAGEQVFFGNPDQENHALDVALSPDEKWIAVEGRYEVLVISAETGKIVATLFLKDIMKGEALMNTFSGICWLSKGGDYRIFWGSVGNKKSSYVLSAAWNGRDLFYEGNYTFPAEEPAAVALPNEVLAITEENTDVLYVVLNGNNTVCKINAATREILWKASVGVAPFGITKTGNKLYVTNWAGAVPEKSDPHVAGVPWGKARVDSITGATREGTVSVLNAETGQVKRNQNRPASQ